MGELSLEEFSHRHPWCAHKWFLWRFQWRWKASLQIYLFNQWWPQYVIPYFLKDLKYNSYSLNLNVYFFLSLQPPILLSVMVANTLAVFSLAANSVSYRNIVYARAIYFSERWKADYKSRTLPPCWNVFQCRTLQYHFWIFILFRLVKHLLNNWFIKSHSMLEIIANVPLFLIVSYLIYSWKYWTYEG